MLLPLTDKKPRKKIIYISFCQKFRTPKITEKCLPRMSITISLKQVIRKEERKSITKTLIMPKKNQEKGLKNNYEQRDN